MAKLLSGTRIYGNATIDTVLTVSSGNPANTTTTGSIIISGGLGATGNIYSTGFYEGTNKITGLINSAFTAANSAGSYANSAYLAANNSLGIDNTQNNRITVTEIQANGAYLQANSAYDLANTKYNSTGGTISGDVSITGNLTITGNSFSISASQIVANDTLFIMGINNYTGDVLDIGLAAHYNDGTNAHTGFIRDAGSKEWHLFKGYTPEIGSNNNIDINHASFTIDTLHANLHGSSILLKNIDLLPYTNIAFSTANVASQTANAASSYANSAFIRANNSLDTTTGGSVTGSVVASGNVRADYVVANSGFSSTAGSSRLTLSDIGIVAIDVAGVQTKFGASGIESSLGIYGGSFGGNKLSLSNETNLISNRYDTVKIQTGTDGTTVNDFVFANNSLTIPGNLTVGSTNVVATIAASFSTANAAFIQANAAFAYANSLSGGSATDGVAREAAASAGAYANGAFIQANSTYIVSNTADQRANAAFVQANAAYIWANAAFDAANNSTGGASAIYANGAFIQANAAFLVANNILGIDDSQNNRITVTEIQANGAFIQANGAFEQANISIGVDATQNTNITAAFIQANAAFDKANTGTTSTSTTTIHPFMLMGA